MNNTGIIILAAGNSSRFGKVKQLLHFNGKTLLQHAIDEAETSGAATIVIVTGANAKEISGSIKYDKTDIIFNKDWQQGMASGIAAGLKKAITLNNDIEKIIIAVCDQPFVSSSLFLQLDQTQKESAKHIVACSYADTIGTPALFTEKYFDDLMNLKGEEGAKKILKANMNDVAKVNFPQGNIDIDTPVDYQNLTANNKV